MIHPKAQWLQDINRGLISGIRTEETDFVIKSRHSGEETRASANGRRWSARDFFQRKSQHDLKATGVQNYTANGRRWSAIPPLPSGWAPALPNGASWLFHVKTGFWKTALRFV
jgi:hypothetical protein